MRELNNDDFDEAISKGKSIVDFWASWCGPCKMFAPIYEETAGEVDDINFFKLNTEDSPEVAGKSGIRSIPTLVFYKDGQEVGRQSGAMPKPQFKQLIDQMFAE